MSKLIKIQTLEIENKVPAYTAYINPDKIVDVVLNDVKGFLTIDVGGELRHRISANEWERINALLLGDTPAPAPTPAEPVLVDDAWWNNLSDLASDLAQAKAPSVETKAWLDLKTHVRTYNPPALPADAMEAYTELMGVLADTWSMEELYDAANDLATALTRMISPTTK